MNKPLLLLAAALSVSAAPARADNFITDFFKLSRTQANNGAANERACLAQARSDMNAAATTAAVRAALGASADAYLTLRGELTSRFAAVESELARALAQSDDAAAKSAVEAARRRAAIVRHDAMTWTVLPLGVARIDSGADRENARHRGALVSAMRGLAASGDFQAARDGVLAAVRR